MTTIEQIKALQTLIDQYEPVVRAAVKTYEEVRNAARPIGWGTLWTAYGVGGIGEAVKALPEDTKALLMGEGG